MQMPGTWSKMPQWTFQQRTLFLPYPAEHILRWVRRRKAKPAGARGELSLAVAPIPLPLDAGESFWHSDTLQK